MLNAKKLKIRFSKETINWIDANWSTKTEEFESTTMSKKRFSFLTRAQFHSNMDNK